MSIGFESEEVQLRKLRERLREMSDAELIQFGKAARKLTGSRVSGVTNSFERQLIEAREEWKRRG
jgi:hypothetical protein